MVFPVINRGLLCVGGRVVSSAAATKQRGQHLLEPTHKNVGLAIAFDQSFDGAVFAVDLLAEEVAFIASHFELALEMRDIARRLPCCSRFRRDLS